MSTKLLLEQRVKLWAKEEFNQDLQAHEVKALLTGRNGAAMTKMFESLTENVVSKRTFEVISSTLKAKEESEKMKEVQEEIERIHFPPEHYKIKPEDFVTKREQEAFHECLAAVAGSLRYTALSGASSGDKSSESINVLLRELYNAVENLEIPEFTMEMLSSNLPQTSKIDHPRDIVIRIEESIEKINDMLFDLQTMSSSGECSEHVELDINAILNLANHKCGQLISEPSVQEVKEEKFEPNEVNVKKLQTERELITAKLKPKMERAIVMMMKVQSDVAAQSPL